METQSIVGCGLPDPVDVERPLWFNIRLVTDEEDVGVDIGGVKYRDMTVVPDHVLCQHGTSKRRGFVVKNVRMPE